MKDTKNKKYKLLDYVFWFLFILFTNPGGIFAAFGEDTSSVGTIDSFDFLFFSLFICYLLTFNTPIKKSKSYNKLIVHIVIFGLYYLIVFGFFIPILKETYGYNPLQFIKKSRKTIYSLMLFPIIYQFYLRSYVIFFWTLMLSSILILSLFFISVLTGFEILPVSKFSRGFVNVDRLVIANEALMILLVPMGVIVLVFKLKFKKKIIFLLSFVMMFLNYILSITRRDIIGTVVYFIIASILFNLIYHKPIIPVKKILSVSVYLLFFGFFISFSFPDYGEAVALGMQEAVSVFEEGKTKSGKEDVRLGLGKEFMQNLIINNPWVGTGFDNRWRGRGDREGYETSDYPFLSAIAMTGVLGILIFIPIYIILVRALIFDIKFFKNNSIKIQSKEFFILIVFVLIFIYDLMQYMNWFLPVSLSRKYVWYTNLAMYFASRQIFYSSLYKPKKLI